MFGEGGDTLVPLKHITPILVIYTTVLRPGDDPYGRADVETIVSALRGIGWLHTAIAVQKHDGSRLKTVPVYLSRPGFLPGYRCGFGPSTTTLELLWSAGDSLTADSVRFLEPRGRSPLNGCDVHVAPLESAPYVYADPAGGLRGLDINLVNYFAAYGNATVYFLPLTVAATNAFLRQRPKKTKDSIYQAFKQYDVVVGGLFPTVGRCKVFDPTAPYGQDAISAFVTARLPVDAWRYPFVVLSPRLWAAVCGVMVLLVVVFRAISGGGFENVIVLLGVLLDGEPNPKLRGIPKRTVFLIFLWTIFCMHFNSGYRASLAMAFIDRISQPGPSGIRDVKRVGFLFDVATYLLKEDDKLNTSPRLEICNSLSNCSAQIRRDPENMGFVMSEASMWAAAPRHFMDDQLKLLLRRSERLATFFVSFLVHKGSLLREPLDDALTKTREFGLTSRAFTAIERNLTRFMAKKYRDRLGMVNHNGLSLVVGVCGLLLAGLALATLVFCGELVHHRLSQARAGLRLDAPRISSLVD
ncbi:uncharacterized protein LOC127750703 [Frankliniella occidentalis]|uniref:Uncharacterized protein LOC127750703 n=1 Tax=Frankliniella occidentalis TaxID=133901 RepID=A0A9C6XS55_FRAOC|nr:uncharacterized protein LOC127750703 [Frankliniella occidentalis]